MVEDRELLTEREDLEMQGSSAVEDIEDGPEQRNENCSHAVQVTLTKEKTSTIPRPTEFLASTGCITDTCGEKLHDVMLTSASWSTTTVTSRDRISLCSSCLGSASGLS